MSCHARHGRGTERRNPRALEGWVQCPLFIFQNGQCPLSTFQKCECPLFSQKSFFSIVLQADTFKYQSIVVIYNCGMQSFEYSTSSTFQVNINILMKMVLLEVNGPLCPRPSRLTAISCRPGITVSTTCKCSSGISSSSSPSSCPLTDSKQFLYASSASRRPAFHVGRNAAWWATFPHACCPHRCNTHAHDLDLVKTVKMPSDDQENSVILQTHFRVHGNIFFLSWKRASGNAYMESRPSDIRWSWWPANSPSDGWYRPVWLWDNLKHGTGNWFVASDTWGFQRSAEGTSC